MEATQRIDVILPAYNPNGRLTDVVEGLVGAGFARIIVIDDGSGQGSREYFDSILAHREVHFVQHAVNLGKGRALKSGFNHWLNEFKDSDGVVTMDSDGQHAVEDVVKCCELHLRDYPSNLVVGCRNFSSPEVPFRSRFGNKLTRIVMSLFCGITITDTQSGLRCIPRKLVSLLMNAPGERYEFETNMLLVAQAKGFSPSEVPIKTIYLENNTGSHFNPLVDSLKIYAIICKYVLSSLSSFLVDISIFTALVFLLKGEIAGYILASTVGARVVSSLYNYYINRKVVFEEQGDSKWSALRYFSLCVAQMFLSAFLVSYVYSRIPVNESLIKGVVDSILFVVNFIVQREWVFKRRTE
jgi:glycosyltransferase involved in cell wall biosynthesis